MPTIQEIEARTKAYAEARSQLSEIVSALQEGLHALKQDNLPRIRRQVARVAELQAQLRAVVADAPELFVRPRTVVLHGIRIGYEKGQGSISFEDADQVVALIAKRLPDLADVLIRTVSTPLKTGLAQLTVQQLKSIGCTVEGAGDRVVVRAVDSEVDKLVTALLRGAAVDEPA